MTSTDEFGESIIELRGFTLDSPTLRGETTTAVPDPSFTFVTRSTLDSPLPFVSHTSTPAHLPTSIIENPSTSQIPATTAVTQLDTAVDSIGWHSSFPTTHSNISPIESSISLLPSYVLFSGPNIPVSSTSTIYTSTTPTPIPTPNPTPILISTPIPTSTGTVPTRPGQSGLSTTTLIPLVVLGVAAAVMALLVTLCMLRRRRRRIAHQDSRIQRDGAHDDRDRFARHSAMVESGALLLPSVRVLSAEAQDSNITPYTHDDSPHTQSQSASPAWTRSSHSKTSQAEMMPARASFSPPGFDDGSGEPLTPLAQPPREEASVPRAMSTEASDTVLLRLPVDLARGLIALVAGANVRGGVRYAGESEDGQGSEYLPAYESEPSASEVNRARSAS